MAHYAKVKNGIVETVIVAEQSFLKTFVDDSPGEWIQTSYNTRGGVHYDPATGEPSEDQSKALRKNYQLAKSGNYNSEADAFYPSPARSRLDTEYYYVFVGSTRGVKNDSIKLSK